MSVIDLLIKTAQRDGVPRSPAHLDGIRAALEEWRYQYPVLCPYAPDSREFAEFQRGVEEGHAIGKLWRVSPS